MCVVALYDEVCQYPQQVNMGAEPGRRRSPAERPPLTRPCCYLSAPFPYVCPGATFTFWPTPLLSGLRLYCAGLAHCGGDLGPKRPVTPHRSGGPCGSGTPAGAGGRAGQAATGYSFVPVRSKSPSSLNGVMRTSVLVALMKLAVLPIESVPANVATMASASPPS